MYISLLLQLTFSEKKLEALFSCGTSFKYAIITLRYNYNLICIKTFRSGLNCVRFLALYCSRS
jgi:hypothetical protein